MTRSTKRLISGVVVLGLASGGAYSWQRYRERSQIPEVQAERIGRRNLVATVAASGKIEPETLVNISADTMGRVTDLAVEEGQRVETGQFLMLIDPESAESAVEMGAAGLRAAQESLNTARVAIETAKANLELSERNETRARELSRDRIVSAEELDRVQSEVKVRRSELAARETELRAQGQRLQQETANLRSARHTLSKVTIDAPMDGMITRLNIEQGETVVIGTMNNAGTVLMTIADLSVILSVLEVDETDILDVRLGQETTVQIDALPDVEFKGYVTKIGSSAIQAAGNAGATNDQRGTNFEVEVTIKDEIPGVRPDFSCTAEITTATRDDAIAVPIQALTVRENEDEVEEEGVFVLRDGVVTFTPVEVGIAGERYFEVLSGLSEGDEVVTGPYSSVRELEGGDAVTVSDDEADDAPGDRS
ncbi:MAG: efflux RND transporter periplasmic adaptor subunit [Vicinamibacterales bacterium]|jgi:HlyD family secretion protein|nr:efflux RND transporter periplasmic adaptor subunit [Vicinamibacterales bacterium]MDP6607947.1 efflux RND transporter periplasmic adaptor subunit [Vicinamibacterales bacterium]|tara:strand:- start:8378 stop:9646 length:1269 start_codon:yes stop_codon:yes gene_type:complete